MRRGGKGGLPCYRSPATLFPPPLCPVSAATWFDSGTTEEECTEESVEEGSPFHQYTNYRLLLLLQPSLPPTTSTTLTRDERRRRGKKGKRARRVGVGGRGEDLFFLFLLLLLLSTLCRSIAALSLPRDSSPLSLSLFLGSDGREFFFPLFFHSLLHSHNASLPVYIITRYNSGNDNFAFGTRVCGLSHYAGPFRWLPLGRASFLRRKVFHEVSRWGSQIVPGGARGARTYVDCTA